nr:hypothetical protein [Desulfobacterales bacterium]
MTDRKNKRGCIALAQPLISGQLVDFITGEIVDDTEDERCRQKIAKLLVEEKGYSKEDVQVNRKLELVVDGRTWVSRVDFALALEGRVFMIIRFGPGSIVSRERPVLAAARLLEPYEIPFAVVTNGSDAQILDTSSGKVVGQGMEAIPSKGDILKVFAELRFNQISRKRLEMERRILFVFDAVGNCELS